MQFSEIHQFGADGIGKKLCIQDFAQFFLLLYVTVDKVDQDRAGQLTEADLPCRFPCCFLIDPTDSFRVIPLSGIPGRIDIDYRKSLCLFDDQRAAGTQRNGGGSQMIQQSGKTMVCEQRCEKYL